jgi:hypothetical protein
MSVEETHVVSVDELSALRGPLVSMCKLYTTMTEKQLRESALSGSVGSSEIYFRRVLHRGGAKLCE